MSFLLAVPVFAAEAASTVESVSSAVESAIAEETAVATSAAVAKAAESSESIEEMLFGSAFGGAIVGSMLTAVLIASIAYCILLIVANWKIFTKAGEAGWKSIIPFLNTYTEFKICWNGWIGLITMVLLCVCYYLTNTPNRTSPGFIIGGVISIVVCIVDIIESLKLSKSFGKGIGFGIGLILLSPIFRLILGFGSAEYQGKAS